MFESHFGPGTQSTGMAISEVLGERRTVELRAGTLEYRERGSGPPVVFAHGAGVNGDLWRNVAPELAGEHRCVVPDLPLGGHWLPLRADADLSLFGAAAVLADFLDALDLGDVTLVANDTGGAISQALVGRRPERIGRLVLTSCDAFENFPPKAIKPALRVMLLPGAMATMFSAFRLAPARHRAGKLMGVVKRPIDTEAADSYFAPLLRSEVRRDVG